MLVTMTASNTGIPSDSVAPFQASKKVESPVLRNLTEGLELRVFTLLVSLSGGSPIYNEGGTGCWIGGSSCFFKNIYTSRPVRTCLKGRLIRTP